MFSFCVVFLIPNFFSEFKAKQGVDLHTDKVALQRVREASEAAKHDLSTRESVAINLPYITTIKGQPVTLDTTVSRATFEKLAEPLIKRSMDPIKTALKDAGMFQISYNDHSYQFRYDH